MTPLGENFQLARDRLALAAAIPLLMTTPNLVREAEVVNVHHSA